MPDLHYSEQPVYSQHAIAGDYYHYELPLQAQLQNRPPPPADAPTPDQPAPTVATLSESP